jgi:hypothetical protein
MNPKAIGRKLEVLKKATEDLTIAYIALSVTCHEGL